ncbi:Hypothetical protein mma_1596 [Janthinobacterium sp. Marseille]|nr:hypothetical protein [Janthinobacterium sp. Marseille]ABR91413.1 Hypothetical protein mma_1596 [Janthinobacterium sp. Marseille]
MWNKIVLGVATSVVAVTACTHAFALDADILRNEYGSGTPGVQGMENASSMGNDLYHAPQYLPGHPTAATIWPRVVDVPCVKTIKGLQCQGYEWQPKLGRAEYLYFRPLLKEPPTQVTAPLLPVPIPKSAPMQNYSAPVLKKKTRTVVKPKQAACLPGDK